MSKRKKSKAKDNSKFLIYLAWSLAFIAVALFAVAAGYYIGMKSTKAELTKKEAAKQEKRLELLKKIEEANVPTVDSVNDRLKKVLEENTHLAKNEQNVTQESVQKQTEQTTAKVEKHLEKLSQMLKKEVAKTKEYADASHEYVSDAATEAPERIVREQKVVSDKPKLAIIIDDVSVRSQVKAIKDLNMNLTMSFLPPSPARPNSAKLAATEDFYMVHLPMEAESFTAEEPLTLRVEHSQEEVSQRVQEIKKLFPKVRYINNHTGSKYTADEKAVNRLILALNANNISFVDSRTTSKTQVPTVMKNFALKYVARDVFLDHHSEKEYVIGQIKQAIRIAKNEGLAIAIGHPHKNTLAALRESKELLGEVDLVYINKVY